jgi:hypothetical protein
LKHIKKLTEKKCHRFGTVFAAYVDKGESTNGR